PERHWGSELPHGHRPNGRDSSTSPPQARHRALPGTSTMSSWAPSAAVPSAAAAKQNRSASGSTTASFPTSSTIRDTRPPALDSTARSITRIAIPSSCTGGSQLRDQLLDQGDGGIDGGFHRRREPHLEL